MENYIIQNNFVLILFLKLKQKDNMSNNYCLLIIFLFTILIIFYWKSNENFQQPKLNNFRSSTCICSPPTNQINIDKEIQHERLKTCNIPSHMIGVV